MNSKQIADDGRHTEIHGPSHLGFKVVAVWLKEIAYQLAVMNEQNSPQAKAELALIQKQAEAATAQALPKVCHHHRVFPECNICEPAPRRSRGYDPCCSFCKILGVACAGHRA